MATSNRLCECRGPDDTDVIDHFVLSHNHEDHTKYIDDLVDDSQIRVENWYRPPVPSDEDDLRDAAQAGDWDTTSIKTRGEEIPFGDAVDVEVKHPQEVGSETKVCDGSDADSEDCNSLVVEVTHEGHTVLFTGDIKSDSSSAIQRLSGNEDGVDGEYSDIAIVESVDVLKLPHHGTDSAHNEYMIDQIGYTSVISNNDRGGSRSPGSNMIDGLESESVMTYWTATQGDIVFRVDEEGRLGVVREDEDGDDLDDETPPIASELRDEFPHVSDALGPVVPGPPSAGTRAFATGST